MKYKKTTITEHINTKYKSYALYSLQYRGIPNFYDSLTNVQRFIIQNSPDNFTKTIKIIGDCLASGYAHGDASVDSAVNKLARPYNCSMTILDGYGFFGNVINNDPAASRYTKVKLSKKIRDILDKHYKLNYKDPDGNWNPLSVDIPFALTVNIIGIAVGYSCNILPRKLEHIKDYLNGKRKSVKPYFMGYDGDISQHGKQWVISPVIDISEKDRIISIKDIPHSLKYSTFLQNINKVIEKYSCNFINNTKDVIDLKLKFNRNISIDDFNNAYELVKKYATVKETENIVFIKDSQVLVYDSIEDYLDDFINYREILYLNQMQYDLNILKSVVKFNTIKLNYIKFMLIKKRTQNEIDEYLDKYKTVKNIYSKLDSVKLRNLNLDYIKNIEDKINDDNDIINKMVDEIKIQMDKCDKVKDIPLKANSNRINI